MLFRSEGKPGQSRSAVRRENPTGETCQMGRISTTEKANSTARNSRIDRGSRLERAGSIAWNSVMRRGSCRNSAMERKTTARVWMNV